MKTVLQILYGAGLTVGASLALGSFLLARLRGELRRAEFALFAFLCGAGALSLLTFLLGTVHLVRRGVLQALALLLIAGAAWFNRRFRGEPLPAAPVVWRALFWLGFVGYVCIYFVHALAPEVSPDGVAYHLEIVGEYSRSQGLVPITTNMYASLPEGLEMLFLFAYTFGRNSAAALVHFSFLVVLPLLLLSYGQRFGFASAGAFAGMAVFACPLVGIDGASAYNDVALATVAFGVFYLLELWDENRNAGLLPLVGLLAGFCYALKYTGAFVIPVVIGLVVWRQWRAGRGWWRDGLTVSLCAAALVAPWMLKNWIWVGNPLAPFYNSWFPNPFVHISFEQIYWRRMAAMQDGSSRLAGLWDALFSGCESQGAIGPLFLLSPLALLALRRREGRRLLAASLVLLPGYVANYGARFLLPSLPFVALALGLALSPVRWVLPVLAAVQMVISLPGILPKYLHPYSWRLEWPSIPAALRLQPEDEYIIRRIPAYPVARRLDAILPVSQTVYAFESIPTAYTRHRILCFYTSAFTAKLTEFLECAKRPEDWLPELRYRFPLRTMRRIRVVRTAPRSGAEWCMAEMRAWNGGRELERQPGWRLNARPNPWDVQMAFDNSYVTRWCTREPAAPGMWVEIDFGRPTPLDMVTLEANLPQPVALRVEGLDEQGRWVALSNRAEAAPARKVTGLRRAAMEEFKARGVRYLLVKDTQSDAEDFWRNARFWGITQLFEVAGFRLYRID